MILQRGYLHLNKNRWKINVYTTLHLHPFLYFVYFIEFLNVYSNQNVKKEET